MTESTEPAFEEWAVVELMGHRRLGGRVSEQRIAGSTFLRVDVPASDGSDAAAVATQFYSPSAVYCITPTTEELARATAARHRPAPVTRFELGIGTPDLDYED